MKNRIDEILAICDRVFGPDDNGPVPTDQKMMGWVEAPQVATPAQERFARRVVARRPLQSGYPMSVRAFDFYDAERLAQQGGGKLCHNTSVVTLTNGFGVVLHNTMIFEYDAAEEKVRLNTGGYYTVTTKQRLNRLLGRLGYRITQMKYEWYVNDQPFHNGMAITVGV